MSEKPIIFSAPMVRALLDGKKTQTRRVIKPQPELPDSNGPYRAERRGARAWIWMARTDFPSYAWATNDRIAPYAVGDVLWVRETHLIVGPKENPERCRVVYRATNDGPDEWVSPVWTPSIFLPRWASRISLDVTAVRCERLQDISEADAQAEGVFYAPDVSGWMMYRGHGLIHVSAVGAYQSLWDSINGKNEPWEANPWVWVISFRRRP